MKFYIDIGHDENGDPGAINGGLIEHNMNMVTGSALAARLVKHGHIVKVESGDLDITASAKAANAWGADFILSQHYNAGGGDRGEVIYAWKNGSEKLANAVAMGLKNVGQTQVNVVKSKANSAGTAEYFGIIRTSTMPGVIIEPVFIDNIADRQLADTSEEQVQIGISIADAIASVYGSNLEEEVVVVEQWKLDIIQNAKDAGLISQDHNPDDPATKWFVLQVIMNALKGV